MAGSFLKSDVLPLNYPTPPLLMHGRCISTRLCKINDTACMHCTRYWLEGGGGASILDVDLPPSSRWPKVHMIMLEHRNRSIALGGCMRDLPAICIDLTLI